jgi:hypothetical protein
MARITVKHLCGHEIRITTYMHASNSAKLVENMERQQCSRCQFQEKVERAAAPQESTPS